MPSLSAANMEQLFAPGADLSSYENKRERDLYFSLMGGAFQYQGKSAEASDLVAPFQGTYGMVRDYPNAVTQTDDTVEFERQKIRIETEVVDGAYAGMSWPWGPTAHVALSALQGTKLVRFGVSARQEHQELFLSAGASMKDALTGKQEREHVLVKSSWAGNVGGTKASKDAKSVFKPIVFRKLTAREKRLFGVAMESLGQLAQTPS
ncbi:MAG TPA: hypothetical protein VFK11_03475 [Candidatus Saccharimonadales bacterium]|nr:hypothetical protein [Candidatus Saccharimonadales bacterium]